MIYEIKFAHGEVNSFAEGEAGLQIQTDVILRSSKGMTYGKIIRLLPEDTKVSADFRLLRAASSDDLAEIARIEAQSQEAKRTVREVVAEQGLEMKIIEAAYNLDKSQLFISFTAENRVDFRELLKSLASIFRTRIELRQIGARDAAKVFGGIGPCGRPLCCSEFIYEFPNISIKMAKNQALSLKQSKLNGMCGRLMCCLTYEDAFYKEAQKLFPDYGEFVNTADGRGKVIGLNILGSKVKVRFETSVKEFDLADVEVKAKGGKHD